MLRGMFGELLIVVSIILGLTVYANAASSVRGQNSLGVVSYTENPNAYLFASIVDGHVIQAGRKYATNIRFSPAHTFALYNETVLFCGNQTASFEGQTGPLVITYRKQAHEMVGGIACHDLESVNRVAATTP